MATKVNIMTSPGKCLGASGGVISEGAVGGNLLGVGNVLYLDPCASYTSKFIF